MSSDIEAIAPPSPVPSKPGSIFHAAVPQVKGEIILIPSDPKLHYLGRSIKKNAPIMAAALGTMILSFGMIAALVTAPQFIKNAQLNIARLGFGAGFVITTFGGILVLDRVFRKRQEKYAPLEHLERSLDDLNTEKHWKKIGKIVDYQNISKETEAALSPAEQIKLEHLKSRLRLFIDHVFGNIENNVPRNSNEAIDKEKRQDLEYFYYVAELCDIEQLPDVTRRRIRDLGKALLENPNG